MQTINLEPWDISLTCQKTVAINWKREGQRFHFQRVILTNMIDLRSP